MYFARRTGNLIQGQSVAQQSVNGDGKWTVEKSSTSV